jgi:low temperature requirement protein LtrA
VSRVRPWLRYAAIVGNVLFILWIVRNGIDDGFRGTLPETASFIGLVVLLTLDSVLLWRRDQ